ncbi:MAG: AAA family ATPase [Bacteroidales bacterium]|nr:AAA family ATPase [Bacteroidales bacterium]
MEEIVKHINDTNASYRTPNAGDAKNTDLFLDNEHYELFKGAGEQVTVRFSKENLSKAILFIASILPRKYDNSAMHKSVSYSPEFVYDQLAFLDYFFKEDGVSVARKTQTWNARKDVPKKNGEIDNRFYFNGLLEEVEYVNSKGEHVSSKFTIRNYLAGGYSNLHIKKAEDGIFDVWVTNVQEAYFDDKEDGLEELDKNSPKDLTLQQIYYGAPGTGKSHTINENTEGESVIRTTFHPDSDYSTFVGAYKPTMGLLPICDELGQPMKIGSTVLHKEQIIYEFVDQAFLQAYVNAWKFYAENSDATKKQYLVIEEINRGNCAQIFGDLFQLLDRNDYGFSVYPINADKDMKKQLEKAFKGVNIDNADSINQHYKGRNVVKEVLDGDILLLPNNLYIWATMNTSDQSLFPIDSAFKRRWEWQYMPIGKGFDENGHAIKWAIEGATQKFDWWSFLEKINAQVGEATQSEDKKLGFFFCKATEGVISAEKFVGKVIFYLWNDVFKNNGFEGSIFKDVDGTELSFGKFYKSDAKGNAIVQKDKVELFLNNLGVEVVGNTDHEGEDDNEQDEDSKKSHHDYLKSVTFDDEVFSSDELTKFEVYTKSLQKIGLDKVVPIIEQSKYKRLNCPLASKQQYDAIIQSKPFSYVEIDGYQFVKGAADETLINVLNEIKEALNLSFSIQIYN